MYTKLVYGTVSYQIAKDTGTYTAVLCGEMDDISLTGGLAHSQYLVEIITQMTKFTAPVCVFLGGLEMGGLAAGAFRTLRGIECPRFYTGGPVFQGFHKVGQLA